MNPKYDFNVSILQFADDSMFTNYYHRDDDNDIMTYHIFFN